MLSLIIEFVMCLGGPSITLLLFRFAAPPLPPLPLRPLLQAFSHFLSSCSSSGLPSDSGVLTLSVRTIQVGR